MADQNDNPIAEIEDDLGYELIDETVVVEDPALAYQTKIAELEAQILASQAAPVVAPQPVAGMQELADILKTNQSPAVDPKAEKAAKFNAMYQAAEKGYHDDPLGNATKISAALMETLEADFNQKFNAQAAQLSQMNAQSNDAELMALYGDEVKDIASTLPPSGSVYQDAIAQVKMNHYDDIMAAKVQAEVAKAIEAAGVAPQVAKTPAEIQAAAGFTNASAAPATEAVKAPKLRFTSIEIAGMKKWGNEHMLNWDTGTNKEYIMKKFGAHKAAGGTI